MGKLDGKVSIVTGAGQGIGRGISIAFVKEGAKVVIASRETASDGELLKIAITANSVSIMQATPTTWRLLLAAGWVGGNEFTVMCGGEALPQDLAAQLFNSAGSVWSCRNRMAQSISVSPLQIPRCIFSMQR